MRRSTPCERARLSGIAEDGKHSCDPSGSGAAARIHDDEDFHEVVVGIGIARGIDDEHVVVSDRLFNFDRRLTFSRRRCVGAKGMV